jgi:TonB family protein
MFAPGLVVALGLGALACEESTHEARSPEVAKIEGAGSQPLASAVPSSPPRGASPAMLDSLSPRQSWNDLDAAAPGTLSAPTGVRVSDADAAIARLRPQFKACYQGGLVSDPTMSGKVVVRIHIAPDGPVDSSSVEQNSGLSDAVADCIRRALDQARFSAPGGNGSTLKVPVRFVQQGTVGDGGI